MRQRLEQKDCSKEQPAYALWWPREPLLRLFIMFLITTRRLIALESQLRHLRLRILIYSRICLIRHRLIRQFAWFVTFSLVPAEFLSFVYIFVRQFAQFVTSFYPWEAFCSANPPFAVSVLNSKNQGSLYENCCTSQFVYRIYTRCAKPDPTPHWENVESL